MAMTRARSVTRKHGKPLPITGWGFLYAKNLTGRKMMPYNGAIKTETRQKGEGYIIYCCSDIHGRYDRFMKLLDRLQLKKNDHLYILGDVIDRNDGGIKILKYLMDHTEHITLLMGNHEDFMYSYLFRIRQEKLLGYTEAYLDDIWLSPSNGGESTYEAYLQEPETVQEAIFEYLTSLPLVILTEVNGKKYHLSHSGTVPNIAEKDKWYLCDVSEDERFDIVWGSPYRVDTYISFFAYPKDYTCVIGHVPVQHITRNTRHTAIHREANIINIDSGCALSYKEVLFPEECHTALSCLCLDTGEEIYIKEG